MISLVVCVEFDDFLRVTLLRNARHFDHTLVVTSHNDKYTQSVVAGVSKCSYHTTDAFYRNGADFNKGAAIEEGFDKLGRQGWFCVWDADVVMPDPMVLPEIDKQCLYSPVRRILPNPCEFSDDLNWSRLCTPTQPTEFSGYFQIFHSSAMRSVPWYGTGWRHAGGCDSDFQDKYPTDKLIRLPFDVLHLGEEGTGDKQQRIGINWYGRVSPRIDGNIPSSMVDSRRSKVLSMAQNRSKHGTAGEKIR